MRSLFDTPTIEYCEKAIEGIIARPGYAISNVPFILLGIFIICKHRKTPLGLAFGLCSIIIGVFSFIYDASFTYMSQYFDWMGMFLFVLILSLLNIRRIVYVSNRNLMYLGAVILLTYSILSFITQQGVVFFGLGVIFIIFTETYLLISRKEKVNIGWLTALMLFFIGIIARSLDLYGIICDSSNLLNGRAVLHYLSTISIMLLFLYYNKVIYKRKWKFESFLLYFPYFTSIMEV